MNKFLALLLLLPSLAFGGSATLSWTNPTTRVDGSPLTNLALINVYRATAVGGPYSKVTSVTAPAVTYTDLNLAGGFTYFYEVTAVDANGIESAFTNPVSKAIAVSPPNPPSSVTIASTTVFQAIHAQPSNNFAMGKTGTVGAGVHCDPNNAMIVAGTAYCLIDPATVAWNKSPRIPAYIMC